MNLLPLPLFWLITSCHASTAFELLPISRVLKPILPLCTLWVIDGGDNQPGNIGNNEMNAKKDEKGRKGSLLDIHR